VKYEVWVPAIKRRERKFIELPVRCELAVHVERGGTPITRFGGLWFPAEQGKHGVNLADHVRRQERQIFGVEGVERRAYPTIGLPRFLVGSRGRASRFAAGGAVSHAPATLF